MQRLSFILAAAAMAALVFVGPAVAKTGFVARLDMALPVGPPAGSTVMLGWTLIDPRTDGVLEGVTTFVRIHPLGGSAFEVAGREDAAGHYTASFVAPPGGIVLVDFGMLGENCENGMCTRSDVMFPVDEPEAADAASKAGSATPAHAIATPDDVAAAAAVVSLPPGTAGESRPSSIIEVFCHPFGARGPRRRVGRCRDLRRTTGPATHLTTPFQARRNPATRIGARESETLDDVAARLIACAPGNHETAGLFALAVSFSIRVVGPIDVVRLGSPPA